MIIEVLDLDTLKVKSYGSVLADSYKLKEDAYSIEYTTFKVLNATISKGDIVYIKELQYLGVVNNKNKTDLNDVIEIQCAGLDELINIKIPAISFNGVVSTNLALYLSQLFTSNADIKQRIPKLKFINKSSAEASISFNADEEITIHDLLVKAFEVAGVYHKYKLTTNIDGSYEFIEMCFLSNTDNEITLKTDVTAIRSFSYTDNLSQNENKIEFFLKSEDGGGGIVANQIRYLLNDDSITNNAADDRRILPVKTKVYYYSAKDIEDNPNFFEDTAKQELKGNSYNHLIEVSMLTNNNICVPFKDFDLYGKVRFIDGEKIYHTILTGYEKTQDETIVKLIFGKVRIGLIEKLKRSLKW